MNDYRYQLEKYRGRGSRYVCPQCGRKYTFTRYIDTHNNNEYVNDKVGKCNRLDKCGYHYTLRQYFEDNPWLKDSCLFVQNNRVFEQTNKQQQQLQPQPEPYGLISRLVLTLNLRTHCEMFRFAQHDRCVVMSNEKLVIKREQRQQRQQRQQREQRQQRFFLIAEFRCCPFRLFRLFRP